MQRRMVVSQLPMVMERERVTVEVKSQPTTSLHCRVALAVPAALLVEMKMMMLPQL